MRLVESLVVSIALAATSSTTLAEPAPGGVALFEQARFEEAQAFFERVLADPAASAQGLAQAHVYLAALRLVAREEEAASRHVALALALDPELRPPPGSPPRLAGLIADAARALPRGGLRLELDLPEAPVAGAPVRVRARVSGAPAGLVESLGLLCRSGELEVTRRSERPELELEVPTSASMVGQQLSCEATAQAGSGAELLAERREASLRRGGSAEGEVGPVTGEERARRRRRLGLGLGLGLGAAILVAAVVVGVVLGTRPDQAFVGSAGLEDP